MGRAIHRLTAKAVAAAAKGYHADGGGLYLLVSETGAASWVFRFRRGGRLREMGLGSAQTFSLAEARQRAAQQRKVLAEGLDPIEARRAARSAAVRRWAEARDEFIEAQRHGWKNEAQADQWRQSLAAYGPADETPVAEIDTAAILRLLRPIWNEKTETASRVRARIERILSAEKVAGNFSGENPARWRGHLAALLPRPSQVAGVVHHRAMPYAQVPAFWRGLADRDGAARRALRFCILTATRTGETTGAAWPEFEEDVWTIPAERMKGGREHVVPLSAPALAILADLPKSRPPFALSENAMLYLVQKPPPKGLGLPYTVHGFRSSFRDWAAETTSFPAEVVEMALAHAIRNKAEAAYRRGALLAKRRDLMQAWAAFLEGK